MANHDGDEDVPAAHIRTAHTAMVGLVVDRINMPGPWIDHVWMPQQVLTMLPAADPWTVIQQDRERTRYYAGAFQIVLHRSSTGQYMENLASGRPSMWVAMRPEGRDPPVEILAVTADSSAGEGYTETGTLVVEAVAMPPEIAATVAAFAESNHIERVFEKRKRDKSRPREDGPRPPTTRNPDGRKG
jgi:hypothetical protein